MAEVNVLGMFDEIAKKVEPGKTFNFTRESKFSDLGLDSVAMMEIIGELEDELDVKIPDERLAQLQTVGDVETAILSHMQA